MPRTYRVEFRLSMPNRASWNGGWSGEGRNYSVVRELSDEGMTQLFDLDPYSLDAAACRRSWTHRWSDGWIAEVSARVVPPSEELPASDGFNGYEWMIDNILRKGDPHGEVTS